MEFNEIKQVSDFESTETFVYIDYPGKIVNVYSNKATVLKRMLKLGYVPSKTFRMDGEIEGMEFEIPSKDLGQFLRTSIFKYD